MRLWRSGALTSSMLQQTEYPQTIAFRSQKFPRMTLQESGHWRRSTFRRVRYVKREHESDVDSRRQRRAVGILAG